MRRFWLVLVGLIVLAVSMPGVAAASATISAADVAAAVNQFGIPATPDQVILVSDVVAASEHPQLRVESVQRWHGQQLMARLSCTQPGECVPFFAELRVSAGGQTRTAADASAVLPVARNRQGMASRASLVHAGLPATLYLDGDHVHIRITVICLQNGVDGQTVRVKDKEGRMFYTAQVVDAGILKGRL